MAKGSKRVYLVIYHPVWSMRGAFCDLFRQLSLSTPKLKKKLQVNSGNIINKHLWRLFKTYETY
jgi:hypothetical protein